MKKEVSTGLIFVLIGAALAVVLCTIIALHNPVQQVEPCSDGWSTQEEDGHIYKTYIEENDTCKDRR